MTVLIDPPNSWGHGRLWSHVASDSSFEELHVFAAGLGIPRRGFDRDHYDVPAERYDAVVAAGAVPVSSKVLVERLTRAGLRRRKADVLRPRRAGQPLLRPPRLRPGDEVAVAAPSGPVTSSRLDAGVAVLQSWGLSVRVLDHVRGRHEQLSYLSAPDDQRARDLVAAWCDPAVSAVFCARGGYGAQRLLDRLDWEALAAAGPKLLIGFSDVTALHQAFAARLGLATVHGPVVTSLGSGDDESREHLRRLVMEADAAPGLSGGTALVAGVAEGVLVGGNLALLAAGIGTPDAYPADGAIVVLEDIGEEVYRLDRLLTQLLRAGWFDGARGIALGEFSQCGAARSQRLLFADRLAGLGVPVVCGLPFGHGPRNLALPLGISAVLDTDAGTLTPRYPMVR